MDKYSVVTKIGLYVATIAVTMLLTMLPQPIKTPRSPALAQWSSQAVEGTADLLRNGHWSYLPGASNESSGLRISPIQLDLTNPDGSFAQHNPPVNLYGTHLAVTGGFTISASLMDLRGQSALTLYGNVPVVLDEQRYDNSSVRLTIQDNLLTVDSRSSRGVVERHFSFSPQIENTLTIRRDSGILTILMNSQTLGTLPEQDIFASGQVWFGLDTTGSMRVTHLLASETNGRLRLVDTSDIHLSASDPLGLQVLAAKRRPDLTIGTAVSLEPLVSNPAYAQRLAGGWFGAITIENALKAQTVHPLPGVYNFASGDALADFARQNGMAVHGHALAFGEANPAWMQDLVRIHPDQLQAVMTDHIRTIASRYKGQMTSWDVVNESFDDDGLNPKNIWYQAMGESFITTAFRTAHQADPKAKLFINEFGLEGSTSDPKDDKWAAFLALIDRQQALRVPISGVGFQMHIDTPDDLINPDLLRSRMQQLAQRGLLVRVSEMDVYGDDPYIQAREFAKVLNLCAQQQNCVDFTTWGIGEGNGATAWVDNGQLETTPSLPFDSHMQPLPAALLMQRILR